MIVLMGLMLFFSLNGWSMKNDSTGVHPLRGNDTTVTVPLELIRKANNKLIEHKYCPIIIANKDSIINLERTKYNIADSLYRDRLIIMNQNIQRLNDDIARSNKRAKIWAGSTIGILSLFVLYVLIK